MENKADIECEINNSISMIFFCILFFSKCFNYTLKIEKKKLKKDIKCRKIF